MEIILLVALVIVVAGFVALPLIAAPAETSRSQTTALDPWIAQRDAAYDAIRDLDLDYQMGKLSATDYAALRDKYKARAAHALQNLDRMAGGDDTGQDIEAQVARRRRSAQSAAAPGAGTPTPPPDASTDDAIEREIAERRAGHRTPDRACAACAAPVQAADRFCPRCGAALPVA